MVMSLEHELISPGFISLGLCGLIFILVGALSRRYPPSKVNMLYGYRTERSMASPETWSFAHRYSARLLIWLGLALIILAIPSLFWKASFHLEMLYTMAMIVGGAAVLFWRTETELKRRF
jgi:uncharacterized membrane protein